MKHSPEPSSLSSEAYEVVREKISRGELRIGQVISRRKIAADLGMSFVPVTEALVRLEREGFLESRPRAGTRVRIPSRDDVRGHYVVREALETQAARLFAEMATRAEREQFMKLAIRVDSLCEEPHGREFLRLHERLHRRIAECAACPALYEAIERTQALASTWLCVIPSRGGPVLDLLDRPHEQLAQSLCSNDPELAAEAMRKHIRTSLRRTMVRLESYFKMLEVSSETFNRTRRQAVATR